MESLNNEVPQPLVSSPPPPGSIPPPQSMPVQNQAQSSNQYAGFWRRYLAYMVDSAILGLLGITVYFSFYYGGSKGGGNGIVSFSGFFVAIAYYLLFWVKYDGQTLGNRLMAVRVIKEDGSPIDITTGIVRYIGYLVSAAVLLLGFIWVGFDRKKQGWHDKIAKTLVVKTDKKPRTFLAVLIVFIPIVIIVVLMTTVGLAMFLGASAIKKNPNAAKYLEHALKKGTNSKEEILITQQEADLLAYDVGKGIIKFRQEKGLSEIKEDSRLCAFVQRRLQQISQLGRYDDAKGFYEDSGNAELSKVYFYEYPRRGEQYYPVDYLAKAEDLVSSFTSKQSSNLVDPLAAAFCVRADPKSIIVIIGYSK